MLIRQRTHSESGAISLNSAFIAPNRAHNIGLLTKLIEDEEFDELPAVARHALRDLVERPREV
jgi:transposase